MKLCSVFTSVFLLLWSISPSCSSIVNSRQISVIEEQSVPTEQPDMLTTGAAQTDKYRGYLNGKRVGLVVNQTSTVGNQHLIDMLTQSKTDIRAIFAPEHGIRGDAGDGEQIHDGKDVKTGIVVWSLYGKNKKPLPEQMDQIDIMIYDIQDVGVRFYTFISTLHYIMEACAEAGKPLLLLDRPNPNGHYIDGPVLDTLFRSFVGMDPIPVVYGLTPGELALMINGEGWLKAKRKCNLTVIPLLGYSHEDAVTLDIPPSPNLPNNRAINLYPSLCWFEATPVSVGRGTSFPFQVIGYPDSICGHYTFTPEPIANASPNPPQKGKECYGDDLRGLEKFTTIELGLFLRYYNTLKNRTKFFERPEFFDKLAGSDQLRIAIQSGKSEAEIRDSWQPKLQNYKQIRSRYILYPDRSF